MEIIKTQYGDLTGVKRDGYTAYLGIPFAQKPVGELAFRRPLEINGWSGVLNATKGSKNPIQENSPYGTQNTSEDCLYLNIFVPENLNKKAPVMVWIFGGSYKVGGAGRQRANSDLLEYELGYFAKKTGTIVVSFNYRLNVYGFLNLHTLSERFDENIGLYDQALALKFVSENIEAFGGDSENITVFGHSAGASCVLALMTSPISKKYIHKAILQSPCIDHFFTQTQSERMARRYLRTLGLSPRFPESLITLPIQDIERANDLFSQLTYLTGELRCAFSPSIGNEFLPDFPAKLIQDCDIPLIIGSTSSEANLFVPKVPDILLRLYAPVFRINVKNNSATYRQNFCDAMTRYIYQTPIEKIASNYKGPVYVYNFRYVPEGFKKEGLGACHTSELAVEFGWNSWACRRTDPEVKRVGNHIRKIFSDFAYGHLALNDYNRSRELIVFE